MERSSRFISLSGLSGVLAGTYALIGAAFVNYKLGLIRYHVNQSGIQLTDIGSYLIVAALVMFFSLVTGYLLTRRRARSNRQKIWDRVGLRMLINLSIPISIGGLFALVMITRGYYDLISSSMLVFYGLGLINGGKYTFDDIRYLGMCEVILGIADLLLPGHGLLFWSLGFGVLHILYGTRMWWKYERTPAES
ncbi:MAG: hypothetical protein GC181_03405 [Bacteroidetes bacterium]|nr:hypothetical protein [Bacteroidota bacterium]